MVISTICGSPKVGGSNSELHLKQITKTLSDEHIIHSYNINKQLLSKDELEIVRNSDVLVIAFPLYIDGIPSHLLEQLIVLEEEYRNNPHKDTVLYVISNNGFFEGIQNQCALDIMKNFCTRAGIRYGQGIGCGAGEMIGGMLHIITPTGKGPLTTYGKSINKMVNNISLLKSDEDMFITSDFTWNLFRIFAERTFWIPMARKNHIKTRQLTCRKFIW